jgi:nitrile hydratase beta subunit
MGGMHGFGRVVIERGEPVFHTRWEARAHALNSAVRALGRWNIDISRHARERMPPVQYLAASYYERWLFGLETLLVEEGVVTASELATGRPEARAEGVRPLRAAEVPDHVRGRGFRLDLTVPARFRVDDRVVTRNIQPVGHTRLPRYVRGKRGSIERDHGVFPFPDTNARSRDPKPQHCYSVRFAARELWGPAVAAVDSVHVDLFEDYLDAP